MSSVIVLYVMPTGPVVGVLQPVGAAALPVLPPSGTFRLPVGTEATYVQFRSDQLAAAAVETSEVDPLALFNYGVQARRELAVGAPGLELVKLITNAIHIDALADPTPEEGGRIKGHVAVGSATEAVTIELWNAAGKVEAIRVPGSTSPAPFEFSTPVEPGLYVVLVPGCRPHVVNVPARKGP